MTAEQIGKWIQDGNPGHEVSILRQDEFRVLIKAVRNNTRSLSVWGLNKTCAASWRYVLPGESLEDQVQYMWDRANQELAI